MRQMITVVAVVCTYIAISTSGWAEDIAPGTVAVGAASNLQFSVNSMDNGEDSDDSRHFGLSGEMGYFFIKNLEVGASIDLSFSEDSESYALSPYIAYHKRLTPKSHLYTRISAGYGIVDGSDDDGDFEDTTTLLAAEVGYEYFINKNVAMIFGLRGSQTQFSYESHNGAGRDTTTNRLTTFIKLKLYF